jgi:hypothetical protein
MKTQIVSVHYFRRQARRKEREIQAVFDMWPNSEWPLNAPWWARGVRVERAGPFQWAVVATEHRGH